MHVIYICMWLYIYIYISSPVKGSVVGHRFARPTPAPFTNSLLAPTYKISFSSLFCYILSVFEISFSGMGLRPLILVSHFFNIKFKQLF